MSPLTQEPSSVAEHDAASTPAMIEMEEPGHAENLETHTSAAPTHNKAKNIANTVALNASIFMAALDETIVATAVPTMSAELGSGAGYTWIGGAYLLAVAASGPVIVKISDIWGRKPILLCMVALFFFSSLICALSINIAMLIAGRALQGIAGGGFLQLVGVITSDLFSQRQRAVYFTIQMAVWSIASTAGPLLGGVFSQTISWRYCFWINLPVTGIAFLLLIFCLDVHSPNTRLLDGLKALDWAGTFCLLGFVVLLLLGLEFGGEIFPWNSTQVICLITVGAVMAVFFVISEKWLAKYPIFPPRLVHQRSNIASIFIGFAHSFVVMGPIFFLPLYLQSVQEALPLRSGILTLSFTIADALSSILTGVILSKTSSFIELLWAGTGLLTLGSGLLILLGPDSSVAVVIGLQIVVGVAAGVLFQPVLLAIQAHTIQDDVSGATAALGTARTIAGATSVVIGGIVFQNGMSSRMKVLEASGLSSSLVQQFSGPEATANTGLIRLIENQAVKAAVKRAYALSLKNVWVMYTSMAGAALLASVAVTKKRLSDEHTETVTGLKENS